LDFVGFQWVPMSSILDPIGSAVGFMDLGETVDNLGRTWPYTEKAFRLIARDLSEL
jgi:hypothetical protein